MAKSNNTSKTPFYKTGPLYLTDDPTTPESDKKAGTNTKSVKVGDKFKLNHKVIGVDKKTGDVFSRKESNSQVYRTSGRDAQRYARTRAAQFTPRKIKHGYDRDGNIYEIE